MEPRNLPFGPLLPGILGIAAVTAYIIVFLSVESQTGTGILLAVGAAIAVGTARFGAIDAFRRSFAVNENGMNLAMICAVLVITGYFYEDRKSVV